MPFNPPRWLRNRHIQTILSSVGPRRHFVAKRFAPFKSSEQEMILQCADGVRLLGFYNKARENKAKQLVVLIHGWEGSNSSTYMLSLTSSLLEQGIDVFRLNLRDHGDSHHLNKKLFNSTMIDEVISAVEVIQTQLEYSKMSLAGISLGGNFALRVAAMADADKITLDKVVAFCPVLDANYSNDVLSKSNNMIYDQYFVRKWKRSLRKKLQNYPDYDYADELDNVKTLVDMNKLFIPRYTGFKISEDYFKAYAITGDRMAKTICPCYLHFSKDDMIIPYQSINDLADNPDLHVSLTEHGGHCGFIMNGKFESWQDKRLLELLGE